MILTYAVLVIAICSFLLGAFSYRRLRSENIFSVAPSTIASDLSVLIGCIASKYPSIKLVSNKHSYFQLKNSTTSFSGNKVVDKVIIVWSWTSSEFGQRGKEWTFPYLYDQLKMYNEIEGDIVMYERSLRQSHSLPHIN